MKDNNKTVQSKKDKNHNKILEGFQMILFGLKSLFINVPLEKTIYIVLRRIYTKYELKTSLNQKEMTSLFQECSSHL